MTDINLCDWNDGGYVATANNDSAFVFFCPDRTTVTLDGNFTLALLESVTERLRILLATMKKPLP